MNHINSDAMRQALAQTRAGNLGEATDLIQRALGGKSLARPALEAERSADAPSDATASATAGRQVFTCAAGSREYLLDLPTGGAPPSGAILMLHGCTQTPEDFAAGTRMRALADAQGLCVIWPAQSRGANAQSCWNWFGRGDQQHDRGEPAILAGLVRDVMARHAVPEGRVFVAGLSAGAAMAVILGQTHPDLFAAVGAHSGLPYGRATSVPQAFAAMRGEEAGAARSPHRPVPTIAIHGSTDATVAPSNSQAILRDVLDAAGAAQTREVIEETKGGRKVRRTVSRDAKGRAIAEQWEIAGLGHAWSGGARAGSYTDPAGPDASAGMIRFFLDAAG